jgi:membrane-bound lytic murein transglycosylase D
MQVKLVLALVSVLAAGCAQVPMNVTEAEAPAEVVVDVQPLPIEPVAVEPVAVDPVAAELPPAPMPWASRPARPAAMDKLERLMQPQEEVAAPVVATAPETDLQSPPPPPPTRDLWDRVRAGFALPEMDNELVREWENWYASRPDYMARMIARGSHFLFHIVEQVEMRGMPLEIALLPMIESAYNPVAYSTAHASGIWQFIPSTGKHYGLRQNWWYDGRRDVIAATDAALEYLQRLHGIFNDWQLALASYNWGQGAVGRAIERNRARGLPTDYQSLTMPAETRNYVPKLIAVKNIIMDPRRFGLVIAEVPDEPYFETVRVKRHIDMKLAAKLAGMQLEEFRFLNPGHNKPVIKAGEAERIVLPKDRVAKFLTNFENHTKPLVSWNTVRLQKGQRPERVAAEHGITLSELKEVNGLRPGRRVPVGQPLLVPVKGGIENPYLPDLPVTPVTLPSAIAAARNAAPSSRAVRTGQNARNTRTARNAQSNTRRARQAQPARNRAQQAQQAQPARNGTQQAQPTRTRAQQQPARTQAPRNGTKPAAEPVRVQNPHVVRTSAQKGRDR